MPSIIQESRRVNALQQINDLLEKISRLNTALQAPESIAVTVSYGRAKTQMPLESASLTKIIEIIQNQKRTYAKSVEAISKKHRIALEIEDKKLLMDSAEDHRAEEIADSHEPYQADNSEE